MPTPRLLVAAVLVVGLAACGGDSKGRGDKATAVTAGPGVKTEGNAPVSLKAPLSGADEVPGPGVKDGVGRFLIDITGTKGCYDLKVTMGERPTMAHIHQGARSASGPPVVDLAPKFEQGESAYMAKSCVDLTADTAAKLIGDPAAYYVNVHSDDHPAGALRGQLAKF